jgi:peptidyl-dipeptidase Dcp
MSPKLRALLVAAGLAACTTPPLVPPKPGPQTGPAPVPQVLVENPLFTASPLYLQAPRFDVIKDEHFRPAYEEGMRQQLAEIAAIANSTEAPSFANTIVAMEKTGLLLMRVASIFSNLASADTNETREKIQLEMAPKLAAHNDAIMLDAKLFARVSALFESRETLGLDAEDKRLLERYHTDFVRAGAKLSEADKEKLKAMNAELATLSTTFSQNLLKETNASAVVVDSKDELKGMGDNEIAAAAEAAKTRKLEGKYVLALMNTSGQPPATMLENRALRQKLYEASLARASHGGEFDNREVVLKMVRLRAQRAALLGYPNHATYVLEDETALTTSAVNKLLADLAPAAVANAKKEAADMQKLIDKEKGGFKLAAWDWAFYAEKVRQQRFNFDESQLKPYFEMNSVLQNGVFYAAHELYGLSFKERKDLPVYHPDVRVYEVFDGDGSTLGIFYADFYARDSKRGGAWMNEYVGQTTLLGTKAVVANHLNIPKPPAGEPTLLTFDEVTTMFHEFGHALHGLFSNVKYPRFAGTNVPRDFVEYPSQVNEMWATWPSVLANYAKHHKTGEPMPQALLDKVLAAQKFNQGFATTEYLAASLLDQRWHQLALADVPTDVLAFEEKALKDAGVSLPAVPPRYRSTYFSHIFAGGYSAGYYAYLWSEVLDADSVEWFKENGGLTRENGDHFRKTLLSRGGAGDAMTLFRAFRGRDPDVGPLLERRGLKAGKR